MFGSKVTKESGLFDDIDISDPESGSNHTESLKKLPLIKNTKLGTFKMISVLGKGNFGGVYKVKELKSKKYFALKCVPIDPQPGVNRNQQKVVYKTALTESKILSQLKHENVIEFFGTFVLNRNPTISKKSKSKDDWFCLLLEFIDGFTLEKVIKSFESEEKPKMPKSMLIFSFIKILRALSSIHSQKIIHADIHPENILISKNGYDLKISDFGVSKDINDGKLPIDISGHLFYSAPECIDQSKSYDQRADIWSLGIILMNCFSKVSMESYVRRIQRLFYKIKTNPALRDQFMERFHIRDMFGVNEAKTITFVTFFHENKMMDGIIEEFVKDRSCLQLLKRMLCPYEDRARSGELLESKIVKTWSHVLSQAKDESLALPNPACLSIPALIPLMRLGEENLFKICMVILQEYVLLDAVGFVEAGGLHVILERMEDVHIMEGITPQILTLHRQTIAPKLNQTLLKYEVMLSDFISLNTSVLCYLQHKNKWSLIETSTKLLTRYFREFGCLTTLENLVKFQQNSDCIDYFTFLLCKSSKTIASSLATFDFFRVLIRKMNRRNKGYIYALLAVLIQHVADKSLIQKVLEWYKQFIPDLSKSNDLRFFKRCRYRVLLDSSSSQSRKLIFDKILISFFQEILTRLDSSGSSEEEDVDARMVSLLCNIIFMVQNFQIEYLLHTFKLIRSFHPNPSLKITRGVNSRSASQIPKLRLDDEKQVFECLTKDKDKMMEISCSFTFTKMSELLYVGDETEVVAVCYYEVECLNGGMLDDLWMGYKSKKGSVQCLLNLCSGTVHLVEYGKKMKDMVKKEGVIDCIQCETGDIIGCGITNHGSVFWTKNNELITEPDEYVEMFPENKRFLEQTIDFKVSIQMEGNLGFVGKVNLLGPFHFHFGMAREGKGKGEVGPGLTKRRKEDDSLFYLQADPKAVRTIEKDAGGAMILNLVKEKFQSNDLVQHLVQKIEGYFSTVDEKKVENEENEQEGEDDEMMMMDPRGCIDDESLKEIYKEPIYEEQMIHELFKRSSEYKKIEFEKEDEKDSNDDNKEEEEETEGES